MFNRIHRNSLLLAALIGISTSCTEKYDIDLNSSDPQIVVVGTVSRAQNVFGTSPLVDLRVAITRSINFSDDNVFPPVRNALVEITDEAGNTFVLDDSESFPGLYSTSVESAGASAFKLKVQVEGKTITAESHVPTYVGLDSIRVQKSEDGFGSDKKYDINVYYADPVGEPNYYFFEERINGQIKGHYIFEDRLSDGSVKGNALRRSDRELEVGDRVSILMYCIDKNVYHYYKSLGYSSGGNPSESSTPANPDTNLKGALLGYFSAQTYNGLSATVGE